MKKVSILALHLGYGGVEQAISNLANILCRDYNVEIVVTYRIFDEPIFKLDKLVKIKYLTDLKPNKTEIIEAIKSKNILKIFKEGYKSFRILCLRTKTMREYIKQSDADIIISSRILYTELLSKYAHENVITIAQEHRHHNNDKSYTRKLKRACRGIDYLMPVSEQLTKFYEKEIQNNRTKLTYIPHCLEYMPENPTSLDNNNIISIGRLAVEKGFYDLIDVFKEVYTKYPNWKLNIIGDGNEMTPLKNKIKELGMEHNVILHGFSSREYINHMLENSSIYVMTSFEESFGIVLLEAQSFGIPCVAFDSAQGATEIISDSKDGYLIKNRDKDEMVDKICTLISDKELRRKLGEKSRENSFNFSFDIVKEKWLHFLNTIGR